VITLYGSTRSPFARKAALVAHEAGLWPNIAFVEIEIPAAQPNADWRAANPLTKLPTLVTEDAAAIFDSHVICEYFDARGKAGLFPPVGDARWRALTRQALGDGLLEVLLQWRAELRRPEDLRMATLLAASRARLDAVLDHWDIDTIHNSFDIGDLTTGVALCYLDFRFPELDWRQGRSSLAAWHKTFLKRPSVAATPFGEVWAKA
jgi:glutathione S-transferase